MVKLFYDNEKSRDFGFWIFHDMVYKDYLIVSYLVYTRPAIAPPKKIAIKYKGRYTYVLPPPIASTKIGPNATAGLNTPPVNPPTLMIPTNTVNHIAAPK